MPGFGHPAPMTLERFAELAERFGGELAHWPRAESKTARRLLATSPGARDILARARKFDRLLGQAPSRSVPAGLRERLLAAAPASGWRGLLASLWPFGPIWRPATALMGMALVGMFLGTPDAASVSAPVSENRALSEEICSLALTAADVLEDVSPWRE